MKYYQNTDGKRYAYDDDYTKVPSGLTAMTDDEVTTAIATETAAYEETDEYKLSTNKAYLTATDWVCAKCYELGVTVAEKYPDIYAKRTEARQIISDIQDKEATTSDTE